MTPFVHLRLHKDRRRDYRQGDHVCVAYQTAGEQLAVAVHYIAQGLERKEQCLYAADSQRALEEFSTALANAGVDVTTVIRNGSLLLLTKDRAHLLGGRFDPERMLHMLSERVEAALNAGYVGLRTCGDMSWLLDEAPGSEQVVEYEALLNEFFRSVRATGMCQYDVSRLSPAVLNHALETHPSIVVDRRHRYNPYFNSAVIAAHQTDNEEFARRMTALRDGSQR